MCPPYPLGREYRDLCGFANQRLAAYAQAGIPGGGRDPVELEGLIPGAVKGMLMRFALAVQFLTRLPLPRSAKEPTAEDLAGSMAYYPSVGLLLGLILSLGVLALVLVSARGAPGLDPDLKPRPADRAICTSMG
ncbi:MAG: adenosylcobinamide-GDP ribazoletransferase [Limnochordia bacterium]